MALKAHVTQVAVDQAEMARLSRLMLPKWLLSRLKLLKIALKTQVELLCLIIKPFDQANIFLVKLLTTQANNFLLTINTDAAVRSATVSCTSCKENGHTSVKCWFGAESKLRNVVQQLAEAKMILKTKKSTAAEQRALVFAKQTADGYHRGESHLVEIFREP
jgi:hypothetical protein